MNKSTYSKSKYLKSLLMGSVCAIALVSGAHATKLNIPGGDLGRALDAYTEQTGISLTVSYNVVKGIRTNGVKGDLSADDALSRILAGTGFVTRRESGTIMIVPHNSSTIESAPTHIAAAPASTVSGATLETVTVTSSKIGGDVQNIPISITALSQEQLTTRQIAGGPDLIKEVPNLTFSKTNFTGYNIEIRGIGTQAISVTTDPAVAVAFNDTPFLRNHFFEQEFFDVSQVEVLRGPQGTLYGRNATAGVVNVISAKPTDQYEAVLSADLGNYNNRRLEGMLNIPIVGDTLDLRIAGEWTKRDGYTTDTTYNAPIDGRDLWSTRMTLGWKPASNVQTYLVWEHFSESDNRLRSGKQLCKTDYGPNAVLNPPGSFYTATDYINGVPMASGPGGYGSFAPGGDQYTQGCLPNVSLYSPQAFEAPLGYALPYALGLEDLGRANTINPYAGVTQSTNLRQIESSILPQYAAKNDTLEFNANWNVTPELTFTSQTGYNNDFLWSSEDFNRFGANPGFFNPIANGGEVIAPDGTFCDPQLGCSSGIIIEDLSTERAWQLSQEFRLSSNFSGPLNFSAGANFLHYETFEKYYVFGNALTLINYSSITYPTGCLTCAPAFLPYGYQYDPPGVAVTPTEGYIDPNPISHLNDQGHNYYLNNNPYVLNSYALFGEANYTLTNDLRLTGGLRWTDDQKHFLEMPSWVATEGYGYPVTGVLNQGWERFTGRAVVNWTPHLDFTDQTLVYGSYAHGYKAGGANPPGAVFDASFNGAPIDPVHPLTFKPEYIEAFELGTKNTLLDGALTLNGDVFYYNYTGYQVSEIVDRTAINNNYNAHVEGAELETNWEAAPGLKFGFAGGYENAVLASGDSGVDLMDRTAGHPGWYVFKPYVTEASNCIFPAYVAQYLSVGAPGGGPTQPSFCSVAYAEGLDPITGNPYVPNPTGPGFFGPNPPAGYPGFDPRAGTSGDPYTGQNTGGLCVQNCTGTGTPVYTTVDFGPAGNNGHGFSKNLGGNPLPNAPHFTASLNGEYTMPISSDWAATFHTDFYYQSSSLARVFDDPIDKIHGYPTVNVALILTSANGWQVTGYVKNVFDVTAITGTFLNSDDTGLTTNVFLTDPRLFGVRVTKHLDQDDGFWGSEYSGAGLASLFSDTDNGKPPLWIELGGSFNQLDDTQQPFTPPFYSLFTKPLTSPAPFEHPPHGSFDYDAKLSYEPEDSDWVFSAAIRYGRSSAAKHSHHQGAAPPLNYFTLFGYSHAENEGYLATFGDAQTDSRESHTILDFQAGKDVGLGVFSARGSSVVSAGVRFAQFTSSSHATLHARPVAGWSPPETNPGKYRNWRNPIVANYTVIAHSERSARVVGPSISWDASLPVAGNGSDATINFDWGVNAAVLFGRQRARVHHQTTGQYQKGFPTFLPKYMHSYANQPPDQNRSRNVTIPNVGGFAGLSWRYANAKVSFGYRADEFFGAMDGGIDTRKSENVGFFGPYAHLSVGLGG